MGKSIEDVINELQTTVHRGESDIARYRKQIEDTEAKIADAKTTLRTLQAMGITASDDQPKTAASAANLTVPDMILNVMRSQPEKGWEPIQVLKAIHVRYGIEADPNNVRPTMWRMRKDGRLSQDDKGRYCLPSQEVHSLEQDKKARALDKALAQIERNKKIEGMLD